MILGCAFRQWPILFLCCVISMAASHYDGHQAQLEFALAGHSRQAHLYLLSNIISQSLSHIGYLTVTSYRQHVLEAFLVKNDLHGR